MDKVELLQRLYTLVGARTNDHFSYAHTHAEAINHLFLSYYFEHVRTLGKNQWISLFCEESPTVESLQRLEELGCTTKWVPVNEQGQVCAKTLSAMIGPKTALVSMSWANGLTGVIQPLWDIVRVCREKQVPLHIDARYTLGALFFQFSDLEVDFLSFERGLFISQNTSLKPLILGAEPVAHEKLYACVEECEKKIAQFDHLCTQTARLRDLLEERVEKGMPEVRVLLRGVERLSQRSVMSFPGVAAEALCYLLRSSPIPASIGGGYQKSLAETMITYGIDPLSAQCCISFSLNAQTTEAQTLQSVDRILSCAHKLRECSEVL